MKQILLSGFCLVFSTFLAAQNENILQYSSSNVNRTTEKTETNGCNESNTFIVEVTASAITTVQIAAFTFDESTATLGKDFDITPSSITFGISDASVTKEVTVTIYNDAIVEGLENIQMNFENNSEIRKLTLAINDDDYVPRIGSGSVELLNQQFTDGNAPEGWFVDSDDVNTWAFDGLLTAAQRAYVTPSAANTEEPTYEGNRNEPSTTFLMSKEIDANGVTNVTVSFDWEAGGEIEAGVLLDYGEFLYSVNGSAYASVEKFGTTGVIADAPVGANASGIFSMAIPDLARSTFILGWRWRNDELLAGSYSFSIGNVIITGNDTPIESDLTHSDSENVNTGDQIYYISDQDAGIIGVIENASADLGCVTLELAEVGSGKSFTNITGNHSGKVIKITADGTDAAKATYDITLYFTDDELNNFSNPNEAQIIKVNSATIDDATDASSSNYAIDGGLTEENTPKLYRSFKGTFTGNGVFALFSPGTLSNKSIDSSEFTVFPTLVNNSESVNISNSKIVIEKVAIYNITGKLVKSFEFNNSYNVIVPTSKLSSGIYFLKINDDKSNAQKFIVK
jgi:hypothetical protein